MPIYEPKGRARDDSPLSFNIYTSCSHRCKYCYVPAIFFKKREDWFTDNAMPRKTILAEIKKDFPKYANSKKQVWLCFTNDPYGNADPKYRTTRTILEQFLKHKIPTAICSKGGRRIITDLELFKQFGKHIKIGQTLTFDNDKDSLEWEPGASLPSERIEIAKIIHENNIKTFASIEPVVIPKQSISMIKNTIDYIDEYRIGKLNNYKGLDKQIDWKKFLIKTVDYLRDKNKQIFIKKDLADFFPEYLTDIEKNPDYFQAKHW